MTMRLPTHISSWVIHLHAGFFMGWLATLLTQTVLIARRKTQIHMKVGCYGVVWTAAVVLVVLNDYLRHW